MVLGCPKVTGRDEIIVIVHFSNYLEKLSRMMCLVRSLYLISAETNLIPNYCYITYNKTLTFITVTYNMTNKLLGKVLVAF